jgi:hypothetical protein
MAKSGLFWYECLIGLGEKAFPISRIPVSQKKTANIFVLLVMHNFPVRLLGIEKFMDTIRNIHWICLQQTWLNLHNDRRGFN